MTCIVGVVEGGKVHIGGDSAGVSGLDLKIRRDRKVFVNGPFVFGCTTSFRMIQLLQFVLQPPKRHPDKDLMAFMVTDFIDAVRNCLKAGGYAKKENEKEEAGNFLVGYEGRLFQVFSDYQVGESVHGYDACGCGESYAIGSLFGAAGPAKERIERALTAAEANSAGVRGPFHIESV
jgi:hypothetical protein